MMSLLSLGNVCCGKCRKWFYTRLESGQEAEYTLYTLRKKCPFLKLFSSAFSRIRTEYGEIRSISPYSVQMRENADQNNSVSPSVGKCEPE